MTRNERERNKMWRDAEARRAAWWRKQAEDFRVAAERATNSVIKANALEKQARAEAAAIHPEATVIWIDAMMRRAD